MNSACSPDPSSGSPICSSSLDSVAVLSESSTSKNTASPSTSSKTAKANMHHRRTKTEVFCDVSFVPRHFLDSASIYSTENRAPHRSCDLSSQSSSTAASPPRSSCSFNLKNLAVVDKFAHLHDQILTFVKKVSVTDSEYLARTQVIKTIQELVSQFNPAIVAEPFGSFCTGLSLSSSDVDIVLTLAGGPQDKRTSPSQTHNGLPEAPSDSRSSSPSSVHFISGSESSHEDQDRSAAPDGQPGCDSSPPPARASSAQLDWWEIPPPEPRCDLSPPVLGWEVPPPDPETDLNLEDGAAAAAASHQPIDCSAERAPSDPVDAGAAFSFDDIPALLKSCPRISNLRYIKTARIPIIKLLVSHDVAGVDPVSVDVTCAVRSHVAATAERPAVAHSGICVREFVKLALSDYPSIRPLVMILKVILSKRGLSNPYRGGLGSYPLFIMVYYWTRFRSQSGESIKLGREGEDGALGRILMEFLKWASSMFPWETSVLDWSPADSQDGHFCPVTTPRADVSGDVDLTRPAFTAIVVIIDPLNPGTNVAASTFAFWRVRALFQEMRDFLVYPSIKKSSSSQSLSDMPSTRFKTTNMLMMFLNGAHFGSTAGLSTCHHRVTSAAADSLVITKDSPGAPPARSPPPPLRSFARAEKGSHRRAASMASTSSLASAASTEMEVSDQ